MPGRRSAALIRHLIGGGFVLHSFEPNLADVSLRGLDDMIADPLCWFVIGGPAIILATAALYFYLKAKMLLKGETKRKRFD
jgi:hypothetical protein